MHKKKLSFGDFEHVHHKSWIESSFQQVVQGLRLLMRSVILQDLQFLSDLSGYCFKASSTNQVCLVKAKGASF